jgi:hypothetical protein
MNLGHPRNCWMMNNEEGIIGSGLDSLIICNLDKEVWMRA